MIAPKFGNGRSDVFLKTQIISRQLVQFMLPMLSGGSIEKPADYIYYDDETISPSFSRTKTKNLICFDATIVMARMSEDFFYRKTHGVSNILYRLPNGSSHNHHPGKLIVCTASLTFFFVDSCLKPRSLDPPRKRNDTKCVDLALYATL
jgi:hypothetical protein